MLVSFIASAAWYEETKFTCSDPFNLIKFFRNSSWLDNYLPLKFVSVSDGYVYADLEAAKVAELPEIQNDLNILNQILLNANQSKSLSTHLKQVQSSMEVPLLVQNLPSLAGYWVTNTYAVAISGVFSYLFDLAGTKKLNLLQVRPLIATGGVVTEYMSLKFVDGKHLLVSSFEYSIRVGVEDRIIWLGSCTFPAKVKHKTFRTTIGVNDKFIRLIGGKWYVENVSDGDRNPGHLVQIREDSNFLYFQGVDFSAFYDEYRIAKYGGPFEVLSDGNWTNLYSSTRPE